jgi:hypothetical protein
MLKVPPPRTVVASTPPDAGPPWATALNATDEHDEIAVTLLSLAMVDRLMRLTGVLRVGTRTGLRIATIPSLEVMLPDGTPVQLVDARMQPYGGVSWVSWTFERLGIVPGRIAARIDHIELMHQVGGNARMEMSGPWAFSLAVHPPNLDATADPSGGSVRQA